MLEQRAGTPVHSPPQQSPAELQFSPSARHDEVHTEMPLAPGAHVPRQQSVSSSHGVPGSRHGPGPRSQRCVVVLHTPEQQPTLTLPPVHDSPDARHAVLESSAQTLSSHAREQHSSSEAHAVPTTLHTMPPHVPPLQSSAQQSDACSQDDPSARQ